MSGLIWFDPVMAGRNGLVTSSNFLSDQDTDVLAFEINLGTYDIVNGYIESYKNTADNIPLVNPPIHLWGDTDVIFLQSGVFQSSAVLNGGILSGIKPKDIDKNNSSQVLLKGDASGLPADFQIIIQLATDSAGSATTLPNTGIFNSSYSGSSDDIFNDAITDVVSSFAEGGIPGGTQLVMESGQLNWNPWASDGLSALNDDDDYWFYIWCVKDPAANIYDLTVAASWLTTETTLSFQASGSLSFAESMGPLSTATNHLSNAIYLNADLSGQGTNLQAQGELWFTSPTSLTTFSENLAGPYIRRSPPAEIPPTINIYGLMRDGRSIDLVLPTASSGISLASDFPPPLSGVFLANNQEFDSATITVQQHVRNWGVNVNNDLGNLDTTGVWTGKVRIELDSGSLAEFYGHTLFIFDDTGTQLVSYTLRESYNVGDQLNTTVDIIKFTSADLLTFFSGVGAGFGTLNPSFDTLDGQDTLQFFNNNIVGNAITLQVSGTSPEVRNVSQDYFDNIEIFDDTAVMLAGNLSRKDALYLAGTNSNWTWQPIELLPLVDGNDYTLIFSAAEATDPDRITPFTDQSNLVGTAANIDLNVNYSNCPLLDISGLPDGLTSLNGVVTGTASTAGVFVVTVVASIRGFQDPPVIFIWYALTTGSGSTTINRTINGGTTINRIINSSM